MATVNKDFRVKEGLVVDKNLVVTGTSGTINGSQILTEANIVTSTTVTEHIQDTIGAMVSGNTETNISVTYQDSDGTLDFAVSMGLDDLTDVTITDNTSGEILKWNGTAWVNNTLAEAGISATTHNHTLDSLSNVTITANSNGEILTWNGTAWVNNTLAEAGIAAASHTHTSSNITDFEEAVEDFAAGMITGATHTGISVSYNDAGNTLAFTNTGVTSVAGTANEITVSSTAGAVTIGLPDDITVGGTLTVTGNLVVNGTTTSLNVTELNVEDNIIILNSGVTGTPSLNAGIEVERGTSANSSLYWDETADKWYVNDGVTAKAIALVGDATFNTFSTFSDGSNSATPDSSSDTFTFTAGTGITATVNASTDTLTITNVGVTSVTGTANQVTVSASTGGVTFSLPQSIATTSDVSFGSVTATNALTGGSVVLPDAGVFSSTVTVATTGTVNADSWNSATYSTAKYVVQMKSGTDIHVIEALLAVDTAGNIYITEYAEVISNASLGTVSAGISGGTVSLTVTPASATSTTIKAVRTLLEA